MLGRRRTTGAALLRGARLPRPSRRKIARAASKQGTGEPSSYARHLRERLRSGGTEGPDLHVVRWWRLVQKEVHQVYRCLLVRTTPLLLAAMSQGVCGADLVHVEPGLSCKLLIINERCMWGRRCKALFLMGKWSNAIYS